ncbi:MAG TPA: hypothetical protein VNK48_08075 [Xanthobacteraceae bacterium]|nr:hypothetical protein [Xanthobacteraceae bacterium]
MPLAVIKERPFDGGVRILPIDHALSIADILAAQRDLPAVFVENCEAQINGEPVPRVMWPRVRLRSAPGRDVVVTFTLPLAGGGGGGGGGIGKVLRSVAAIAVLLVAAQAGPWLAQTLWAGAGGLGVVPSGIATITSASLALAGTLAVAALSPPPSLSAPLGGAAATAAGQDEATRGMAALAGNLLARGAPLPRVIGEHRVYPPLLVPPLIEIVGESLVAEAIYGLAGPHRIREPFAGTTAVSSLDDVQIEIQEGLPNSPRLGLVTRQSFTDTSIAVQMTQHEINRDSDPQLKNQTVPENSLPQWEGVASRAAPDEVWIALAFPAGLIDQTGGTIFVPLRIRLRRRGYTNWINLPEVHVVHGKAKPFQVAVKLLWRPPEGPMPPIDAASGGPLRAYYNVPGQSAAPVGLGAWTADAHFYSGAGAQVLHSGNWASSGVRNLRLFADRAEFYLGDAAKFPQDVWEIQLKRGVSVANSAFNRDTYATGGTVLSLFDYRTVSGVHQAAAASLSNVDMLQIVRVASIWNQHPVPDPTRFAVIAVKVTDRALERFSVLAGGYVNDWDGTGWNERKVTANPAAHLRDVLAGNLGGTPLPPELIDDDSLLAWRAHCIERGYEVNAVVEGKTYLDVANLICGAGYARLLHSERWGVTIDRDRSAEPPVQIFTPRNMRDFAWTRAFARPLGGIRAAFRNRAKDYEPDEIIVFADPQNADANNLEQINYDGLTDAAAVETRARFDLEQGRRRLTFYRGTVGIESIVCRRGDLVGVQHDVLATQAGFARIKEIVIANGAVAGLRLDGTIPLAHAEGIFAQPHLFAVKHIFLLGARTGLLIRLAEGHGVMVKELAAAPETDSSEIAFATPFAPPDGLEPDCLVASGRLSQEYHRMIVFGIEPNADLTAQITFVDEAPELFQ